MSKVVAVAALPGDGIGPEVFPHAERLWGAANDLNGAELFRVTRLPYNADYFLEHGIPWPEGTPERLMREFNAMFLVALGDPRVPRGGMEHGVTIILETARQRFNTNFNKRPFEVLHPDLRPVVTPVAVPVELFALTREQVRTSESEEDGELGRTVFTREVHQAADFARLLDRAVARAEELGLQSIIIVHKENVLRHSHGAWKEIADERQKSTKVLIERQLADSFVERLIKKPGSVPQIVVTDFAFSRLLARPLEVLRSGERGEIPVDLYGVVGRENTEGMYIQGGEVVGRGNERIGVQIGRHSHARVRENLRTAAHLAQRDGQAQVTVLHLEDVYPRAYGLWQSVAAEFSATMECDFDFMHAGEFVAEALTRPANLHRRVFAADNLLGDICGDATAALVGGLGIPPTNSFNTDGTTNMSFFEPLHGSAPDIAGKGVANPMATMLTVGEMFEAYGRSELNAALKRAIHQVIDRGIRTRDLRGTAGTEAFGQAVLNEFRDQVLRGI